MSNVTNIMGAPEYHQEIGKMRVGEVGYTVPWAYNCETGNLNELYTIEHTRGGTCTLKVKCVLVGKYTIEYT